MDDNKNPTSPSAQDQIPAGDAQTKTGDVKPVGDVRADDGAGKQDSEDKPVYTETQWKERWGKHQSQLDKQAAKLTEEVKRLGAERDSLAKKTKEDQVSQFLDKVKTSGGDVDLAKQLVTLQGELAQQEAAIKQREAEVLKGLKKVKAVEIAQQHGLDAQALLDSDAEDPNELELIALKLEVEQLKQGKVIPQKVDSQKEGHEGMNWDDPKLSQSQKERIYFEKFYPREARKAK